MKKVFLTCLIALSFHFSVAQRNVILIIADDLGTDYLGFYEDYQDTVDIPNLRSLAKRGVRFKNSMVNPVCSATRATLLTGRYGFRTGVGNIVGGSGGSGVIDTAEKSIPKLLKAFNPNIAKANIGKWHLNGTMPATNLQAPLKLGYDHFEGPFIGALSSYTNWTKYTNGVQSTVTTYATTETVNNAWAWIQAQNNKPFFLWLALNAPHSPYHLPPANLHSFTGLSGTTQDIQQNPKKYFKAMLQAMDTEIGRLFDSLSVHNQLDSTDVIFIGDNGNTIQTAQITNTAKAKGTIYEYGVHTPFFIAGPSVVNGGRASDALVNGADIFATVLELFGNMNWQTQIPANKPVDSKSLLPILKNTATSVRDWTFCENFKTTPDANDGKAMRNMEYRLIKFDNGIEEFYHIASDPEENNNLLLNPLTATELTNYNYLCTEMTNLVGTGNYCNPSVGITEMQAHLPHISPNPFHDFIRLQNFPATKEAKLYDTMGKLLYQGNALATQNFAHLAKGIYLLTIENQIFKLLKD
ncbi:MAG: sulfatase-like hydrolase/transferase [Bacteroidia bacterium]